MDEINVIIINVFYQLVSLSFYVHCGKIGTYSKYETSLNTNSKTVPTVFNFMQSPSSSNPFQYDVPYPTHNLDFNYHLIDSAVSHNSVKQTCSFPESMQGSYKLQDDTRPPRQLPGGIREPIQYTPLYVGPTSIPYWGDCVERTGHQYILGKRKVGGEMCIRCFVIIQRTKNVIQVKQNHDNGCFASLSLARRSCPNPSEVTPGEGSILWRSEDMGYEFCPISGPASLSYTLNGRTRCEYPSRIPSSISNCAKGYQLDISFRSCDFPEFGDDLFDVIELFKGLSLECLGTWSAGSVDGAQYFAVYNREVDEYRCGIFKSTSGQKRYGIASLSNDSTCNHFLSSAADGYETFSFHQEEQLTWPKVNGTEVGCEFPRWIQGEWEKLTVGRDTITYIRHESTNMAAIHARCIRSDGERMVVLSQTHCGHRIGYHCIQMKKRSSSVLQFRIGSQYDTRLDNNSCSDEKFQNSTWITIPAKHPVVTMASPLLGHYSSVKFPLGSKTGHQLCYNITSESCKYPDRFAYRGYVCGTDRMFNSKVYTCLGTWEEGRVEYIFAHDQESQKYVCFAYIREGKKIHLAQSQGVCPSADSLDITSALANTTEPLSLIMQQEETCSNGLRQKLKPAIKPKSEIVPSMNYLNSSASSRLTSLISLLISSVLGAAFFATANR